MEIRYRDECNSFCDVEWCSLTCFFRRGYIRDKNGKWLRDEKGNILRSNNRQCDWEIKREMD